MYSLLVIINSQTFVKKQIKRFTQESVNCYIFTLPGNKIKRSLNDWKRMYILFCLRKVYDHVILIDEHFFFQDYTSKNLKGLKVDHDMGTFKEGKTVILTLKDKGNIIF